MFGVDNKASGLQLQSAVRAIEGVRPKVTGTDSKISIGLGIASTVITTGLFFASLMGKDLPKLSPNWHYRNINAETANRILAIGTKVLLGGLACVSGAFGLVPALDSLINGPKARELDLFKTGLERNYEKNSLLNEEIVGLLKEISDPAQRTKLLEQMNFQQLGFVKQGMGEEQFKRLVQSRKTVAYEQWSLLLSLSTQTSSGDLETLFKNQQFQLATRDPVFAHEFQQRLKDNQNAQKLIIQKLWLAPLDQQPKGDDPLVSIRLSDTKTVQVNPRLLAHYSLTLRDKKCEEVAVEGEEAKEQKQLDLSGEDVVRDNLDTFELCLKLLSHQNHTELFTLEGDKLTQFIKVADFLQADTLYQVLENYILYHYSSFKQEAIDQLIKARPDLKKLQHYVDHHYCNSKMTEENWDQLWAKADEIHGEGLKQKCINFALATVKAATTAEDYKKAVVWARKGKDLLKSVSEQDYKNFYTDKLMRQQPTSYSSLQLKGPAFALAYEFAIQRNIENLKKACTEYCKGQKDYINTNANLYWPFGQMPNEISTIIYSTN